MEAQLLVYEGLQVGSEHQMVQDQVLGVKGHQDLGRDPAMDTVLQETHRLEVK